MSKLNTDKANKMESFLFNKTNKKQLGSVGVNVLVFNEYLPL